MIISNSNNFVTTRAQRTAGTSLEMYIIESGLVDFDNDSYTLEGGFETWEEFKQYSAANNNLSYSDLPESLYGQSLEGVQITFADLVAQNRISPEMPCIGGIRHPLEWLASLFNAANVRRKIMAKANLQKYGRYSEIDLSLAKDFSTPDASCDFVLSNLDNPHVAISVKDQVEYYPDHAQLFNLENIHEHVCQFIKDKGGKVPTQRIALRYNEYDPTYYISNLSADRKQNVLTILEKDLVAWEKAHAKFN
tara:strand:+ start:1313 stop:2062 length:750 start_codon:yes stop_codon:yes gene_type:complete